MVFNTLLTLPLLFSVATLSQDINHSPAKSEPDAAKISISESEIRDLLEGEKSKDAPKEFVERLEYFAKFFQGRPFAWGPRGEGADGEYDRDPLVFTETFDCVTLIETVMAMAYAKDYRDFEKQLRSIAYKNSQVDYVHRLHFAETDWIPENTRLGRLKDVTAKVLGEKAPAVTGITDRPAWYAAKKTTDLKLPGFTETELTERLAQQQLVGSQLEKTPVSLSYVPISALYPNAGDLSQVNEELLRKIPNGSVLSIVRQGYKVAGTNLLVSHQALVFQSPKGPVLRHARLNKPVEEILLRDYIDQNIRDYYFGIGGKKTTIVGFNLQQLQ